MNQPRPPDAFYVTPGIGPLPPVYIPRHHRLRTPAGGAMPDIPIDLRYSQDHLWVRADAGASLVRVGVTHFAQRSLGDVVDVRPPGAGETVTAGLSCGDIESVKSISDLIAPVTGTVRARNDDLTGTPGLVNADAYGQGWLFEIEVDPATLRQQLANLLDAGAYRTLTLHLDGGEPLT